MTGTNVLDDAKSRTGDTGTVLTDGRGLILIRDAIEEYENYVPVRVEGSLVVAESTTDYAAPTSAILVTDVWDFTGGEEQAYRVPFTTYIGTDGLKIRLTTGTPSAGTTCRVYAVKRHTIPSALGDTLSVADADRAILSLWVEAGYYDVKASDVANSGDFKMLNREERGGDKRAVAFKDMAEAKRDEFRRRLRARAPGPRTAYTDGRPATSRLGRRQDLSGANQYIGAFGWDGTSGSDQRRGPS